MTTSVLTQYEIDVEDIEYLRHGDKPLLARVYKPRGAGPFPIVIDVHGGAWCKKDRTSDAPTDEPLARSGVVVVALDFRMREEGRYPRSLADIHYAIRWAKLRAGDFGGRADRVGILGVSSGGQQAMLLALRPDDPRYAAIPLPNGAGIDASVACVVLCWPVIDPLGRYQYAQKEKDGPLAKQAQEWIHCHNQYWPDEAAMAEGSPARILERGERVRMPPAIYLQGKADLAHPVPDRQRFLAAYRKAGGRVELHLFDGVGEAFITNNPHSPQAREANERIIEFVHRTLD